MKKISKIILSLVVLGVLLIIAWSSYQNSSINENKIIRNLEENVLPYVNENKVTYFFNMDWCKAIAYGTTSVSEVITSSAGNSDCGIQGHTSFKVSDRSIFNQLHDLLIVEEIYSVKQEYDLQHKNIGLGFYKNCLFCRTRYVYKPAYGTLPVNIPGEIEYTSINENWYRVDEDWN